MEIQYATGPVEVGRVETDRVVFWANRNPGIRYVRCELPARVIGGTVDNLDQAIREQRFDSYVGPHVFQMPATRFQLTAMEQAIQAGHLVAAEFDDDYTVWADARGSEKWTKREVDAPDVWSPNVQCVRAAVRLADVVIVSTPQLAKVYEKVGAKTAVCRNSVDPADWPKPQRTEDAPFRALFAAAHNPQDFAQVREAMTWLAAKDDAEAIVIGGILDWPGVKHIPWVANDLEAVRAFMCALAPNVGLRPLEPTRFAMGKSDLKILEYAMCGAMSIVAPYEPYKGWEGYAAYAKNGGQFLRAVSWAYENRREVEMRAALTLSHVLETRTIEQEAQAWASALRLS